MKRKYITGIVLCICLSLMLFYLTLQFINSAHEISPSFFSTNEDISYLYNIIVNNTDAGQSANITQVHIILPDSFIFINNSNGTNSLCTFTNTSNVLSWENSIYVINGDEWKYFWFNRSAKAIDKIGCVDKLVVAGDVLTASSGTEDLMELLTKREAEFIRGNMEEILYDLEGNLPKIPKRFHHYAKVWQRWLEQRLSTENRKLPWSDYGVNMLLTMST